MSVALSVIFFFPRSFSRSWFIPGLVFPEKPDPFGPFHRREWICYQCPRPVSLARTKNSWGTASPALLFDPRCFLPLMGPLSEIDLFISFLISFVGQKPLLLRGTAFSEHRHSIYVLFLFHPPCLPSNLLFFILIVF